VNAIFGRYHCELGQGCRASHYLASNPRDAARIANLPEAHQGIALVRLENRLSSRPASRRVTNYPAPHRRVSGGGGYSGLRDLTDASYEKYRERMNAREEARMKRGD